MRPPGLSHLAFLVVFSFPAAFAPASAAADALDPIFASVKQLVAEKNYAKALDELGAARKQIEELHVARLEGFFPAAVGEYTAGAVESKAALGFMNVERTYAKAGKQIKVSLTGGTTGSAGGFGNLAQLGRMAAMMKRESESALRIAGRTALVREDKGPPALVVFLESGSMLQLEASGGAGKDDLRAVAEGLAIDALDKYLHGGA